MTIRPHAFENPKTQAAYPACHVRLGRISFDDALRLQEEAIEGLRAQDALGTAGRLPPPPGEVIFSLEHEPVITCGRSTDPANLLLSPDEYQKRGIELRDIDRGGDVTYHGPGQVVVYPILHLRRLGLRAGDFVRVLEESMIRTCADWGVQAFRKPGYPGCWTLAGKIGAVGTAIKAGGISKHGLSFNVQTDLENFRLIVPCGITGHSVVNLADLADRAVDQDEVETRLVGHLADLLALELI